MLKGGSKEFVQTEHTFGPKLLFGQSPVQTGVFWVFVCCTQSLTLVSYLITIIRFYSQKTYQLCYQKPLNSRRAMQKRKHKLLALYSVADHFDVELPTQFLMISCSEICTQISVNGAKQNFHVVIPLLFIFPSLI